ncbi:MAG: phage tail sheath C-terminal domain-containing protein [Candidatus Pacearchaeota archaeon]|jgi:hypothetical protein|nr:hypothetical protein [Clostridia bacterium]
MAKISLDLNQFKANGVYTVEFDATDSFVISSQQLRLVVGFSRKGPFNAPVFLQDIKSARKIFGEIDTYLEKKGSFFHRAIETALQTGPIFAINLMPLNNAIDGDKIDYRSFSLSMAEDNSDTSKDLMASFFNKERFWFPDSSYFEAIVNNNASNENKLISFTNLGQEPVSIIARKSVNIKGFDITARDFYGAGNAPAFVNDFDYISDYFIDVIVVKGDWTNYNNLAVDPDFSTYFDNSGIKVSKLNAFLSSDKVVTVASFTGCIIPDFTDRQGVNQYIETIVNNAQGVTGIFMTIDRKSLDDYENSQYHVDLIGHSLIDGNRSSLNMLSYVSPISDEITYNNTLLADSIETLDYKAADFGTGTVVPYIKNVPYTTDATRGVFLNTLVIPKPLPAFTGQVFTQDAYNNLLKTLNTNSLIKTGLTTAGVTTAGLDDYVKVDRITNTGTSIEILISNPVKAATDNATGDMIVNYVSATQLTTTSPAALNLIAGDIVFVKTLNIYLTVASVTPGSPVNTITFVSGVTVGMDGLTAIGCNVADAITVDINSVGSPATYSIDLIANPALMYTDTDIIVLPGNKLVTDVTNNSVINGDKVSVTSAYNTFTYLSFENVTAMYGLTGTKINQWSNVELNSTAGIIPVTLSNSYDKNGSLISGSGLILQSAHNKIEENVSIIAGTLNARKTSFNIAGVDNAKIEVGQYLVNEARTRLTRVISKVKKVNAQTNATEYTINVNEAIYATGGAVTRYLGINDVNFTTNLQFTSLGGFTITAYHIPGTPAQLEKILGVIETTNLGDVLADKDMIQFRYLVDTFNGGLAPMMGPKAILSRLAKQRQKCMAILNAPSIEEFIASTDPRFTELPDPANGNPKPVLQASYIATGGNLSLGPSFTFTLPDEENGARFAGVFTPFIKIRENNKNKMVPPAADVSNNFIKKFKNGTPFAIAAGPRRGTISNPKMSGLEYDFLTADREYLEPIGLNCIINSRQYGPMIYGNATAYQKTLSAFNNLHVRDLLITVESDVEDILSNYVFEFNDASTRLELKTIVDGYLSNIKSSGGIYDYIVIMDESNNTQEVIDQNVGIIDIGIEPARGLQKIINRVTVLKTGTVSSGGFTVS